MQALRAEFPNPLQPKQLVPLAKVTHANAKKWLARNEGTWVVAHGARGFYRAMADMSLLKQIGLEPFKVHALQVLLKSPSGGLPPALGGLGHEKKTRSGQVQRVADFLGRRVTVQDGGLVSIRASTDPFTVDEFTRLSAWLDGLTGGGTTKLESVDLNVDMEQHKVSMRGIKSMSLAAFTDGLVKLYDKQVIQATRLEACVHRTDLTVPEAARILQEFTTPVYRPEFTQPDSFLGCA